MRKTLLKTTLGIVLGLGIALPGYCSTEVTLTFGGNTGNTGGITVSSGGTGTIQSLEANFSTLTISGAPDAADNGTWSITNGTLTASGNTLTLDGTIGACQSSGTGGCFFGGGNLSGVGGALDTIAFASLGMSTSSGSPTAGQFHATGTTIQIELGTPTSITELSGMLAILGDAGLSGSTTSTLPSGSFVDGGGNNSGSGTYSYTANSQSLALSAVATPEPSSWLILASGLPGLAWLARRRIARS